MSQLMSQCTDLDMPVEPKGAEVEKELHECAHKGSEDDCVDDQEEESPWPLWIQEAVWRDRVLIRQQLKKQSKFGIKFFWDSPLNQKVHVCLLFCLNRISFAYLSRGLRSNATIVIHQRTFLVGGALFL